MLGCRCPGGPSSSIQVRVLALAAKGYYNMKYDDWKIEIISNKTSAMFVYQFHYARISPSTTIICYGLFVNDELVGITSWGYGVRPKHTIKKLFPCLDVTAYLELNRFCVLDKMPRNTESWFISRVIDRIKRDMPERLVLISWADGLRGKPGYVYQACSWYYGGFINSEFYTDKDGNVIHPRLLITRYGTRGKDIQRELGLIHYFGKQFIYCKPIASNRKNKLLLKNSPTQWTQTKYPKDKDLNFQISVDGEARETINYIPKVKGRSYEYDFMNNENKQQVDLFNP